MIFQNAQSALNPVFYGGRPDNRADNVHKRISREEGIRRAKKADEEMSIPEPERALGLYPHQMSGGKKQRAMIAMSLPATAYPDCR
jgi:ABC-type microcin C transport system duplicated ATPase subunit YejF